MGKRVVHCQTAPWGSQHLRSTSTLCPAILARVPNTQFCMKVTVPFNLHGLSSLDAVTTYTLRNPIFVATFSDNLGSRKTSKLIICEAKKSIFRST